jgi:hypothetical protein
VGSFFSRWDGVMWTRVMPGALSAGLQALHGTNSSNLWIVGGWGQIWQQNSAGQRLVSTGYASDHHAVWASGPDDIWVAARTGLYVRGDGKTWSFTREMADIGYSLRGITGTSRSDVWAVGDGGTARRWNGTSWAKVDTGVTESLFGAWAAGPDDVWAVGTNGTVLRWNAGRWADANAPTEWPLRAVHGTGPRDVWVVGQLGTILHWNGTAWTAHSSPNAKSYLYGVWAGAPNEVWVAGAGGTARRWNGTSWTTTRTGTVATITSIHGRSPTEVWASTDTGLALRWDGTSWTHTEVCTPLTGVAVIGPDDVVGVGLDGAILRRRGKGPGRKPPETSGLDPTRTLSSLNDEERADLCDHTAVLFGGYDAYHTCADGTVVHYRANQQECTRGFQNRTCAATVGEAEECVRLQSRSDCTIATLESPACKALARCVAL